MYLPTTSSFLRADIHAAEQELAASKQLGLSFQFALPFRSVAALYVDLTLLSHGALRWQPSLLAAAALSLALEKGGAPAGASWASAKLARFTGYGLEELGPARQLLLGLARDALEMRRIMDREPKRTRNTHAWALNLALFSTYSTETVALAANGAAA